MAQEGADQQCAEPAFSDQEFRHALGKFATGVTIITACNAAREPVGLTCNSFASVSLNPPLVLWMIARSSRNFAAMCAATHFAIHVLDNSQGDLCRRFANRDADRFTGDEFETSAEGVPLLTRFHVRFECASWARHDAGDHVIIIGLVLKLCEGQGKPLIFHRGAFSRDVQAG